jgi:hypothetical protein
VRLKVPSAFVAPGREVERLVHDRFTCKREDRLMNLGDRDGDGSVLLKVQSKNGRPQNEVDCFLNSSLTFTQKLAQELSFDGR